MLTLLFPLFSCPFLLEEDFKHVSSLPLFIRRCPFFRGLNFFLLERHHSWFKEYLDWLEVGFAFIYCGIWNRDSVSQHQVDAF